METSLPPRNNELSGLNSAEALAALTVPEGSRVLDIGCGNGSTARLLAGRGCRVVGVELNEDAARSARDYCERVIVGDIEAPATQRQLADETFDAIVLLDVLGYLRDPLSVLGVARQLLAPAGRIVTSFANITHGAVRLGLLRGDFVYTESGLLDRRRLRLFDRQSAEALMVEAGLGIEERLHVTRGLEETEIPTDTTSYPAEIVAALRRDRDATTYEIVFVASGSGTHGRSTAVSLAEQLQRQVLDLQAKCRALEAGSAAARTEADGQGATIRDLEARIAQTSSRADGLATELTSRIEELHVRHHEIRQLQSDISVREGFISQLRAQALAERTTLNAVRGELQRARSELADAGARERAERAEQANLLAQLGTAQLRQTELAGQLDDAYRDLATQTTRVSDAQGEHVGLTARLAEAHHDLSGSRQLAASVTAERDAAKQQRDAAEQQRDAAEQQRIEVQAQLLAATAELEAVKREISALRTYANSAGFRLVERVSVGLKRQPRLYRTVQAAIRKLAPNRTGR